MIYYFCDDIIVGPVTNSLEEGRIWWSFHRDLNGSGAVGASISAGKNLVDTVEQDQSVEQGRIVCGFLLNVWPRNKSESTKCLTITKIT